MSTEQPPRPSLRGTMHRSSVPIGVCLTVVLALRAPSAGQRAAVIIYGVCVLAMLTVSGIYHAPRWYASERRLLRRFDHSTIFVAIAGTYTAVIVLGLSGATRVVLLVLAWVVAAVGVAIRMLWLDAAPGLVAAVYLVAGWMVLLQPVAYARALDGVELAFLAAGGVLYSLGAVVYALKRPNPWPSTFGYHEVFHALVVAAAFGHWVSIYLLTARSAR
jgi:hemolysin III